MRSHLFTPRAQMETTACHWSDGNYSIGLFIFV